MLENQGRRTKLPRERDNYCLLITTICDAGIPRDDVLIVSFYHRNYYLIFIEMPNEFRRTQPPFRAAF
jgi:hypothetical protein